MTNEMREIVDQLKALEERSAGLSPLAETAEQPEIEAREKELNAIAEERKALEARKSEIEAEERAAQKLGQDPAAGKEIDVENRKEQKMEIKELRNTPEYIDAFAQAIKGDDSALRSILTENATNGQVPIPEFAEERIRTAWETDEILNRVVRHMLRAILRLDSKSVDLML